jgi:hypothetical protein
VTNREFISRLRKIDPGIRQVVGPGHVAGLYKRFPRHPDANNGLLWIGACLSPRVFSSLPAKDIMHEKYGYIRGWMTTLGLLVKAKHISMAKAIEQFGRDWRIPGIRGKLSELPGWNQKSPVQKMSDSLAALGTKYGVDLA